jgi:hypothetical protein
MKLNLRIWFFRAMRVLGMTYGTPPADWAPMTKTPCR